MVKLTHLPQKRFIKQLNNEFYIIRLFYLASIQRKSEILGIILKQMTNNTRQELLSDVEKHKWIVFNIVDESLLPFSYTVGLYNTFGHPEIIISGIKHESAHEILNDIGSDVGKGIVRIPDVVYDDILNGYPCLFKTVTQSNYEEYLGRAIVYYSGSNFPVLQCIWPDSERRFPDDKSYAVTSQEILYK